MRKNRKAFISIFTLLVLVFISACNQTDSSSEGLDQKKLTISAAASLTNALEELSIAFNEKHPNIKITFNFGGSGNLSQQIQQGAPADVFLSASKADMDHLSDKQLIYEHSRFDFARNELVVITNKDSKHTLSTIEDLLTLEVDTIVMGDTESVPIGRYSKESLENAGVWGKTHGKTVYLSNVRQVLTQVGTRNAELGIVYHSDVLHSDKAKVILRIDSSLHSRIIYPAAMIKNTRNHEEANEFLTFLQSEKAKGILESYGFLTE